MKSRLKSSLLDRHEFQRAHSSLSRTNTSSGCDSPFQLARWTLYFVASSKSIRRETFIIEPNVWLKGRPLCGRPSERSERFEPLVRLLSGVSDKLGAAFLGPH